MTNPQREALAPISVPRALIHNLIERLSEPSSVDIVWQQRMAEHLMDAVRASRTPPPAPSGERLREVWVVTREGPEWSEIEGVYALEDHAIRKAKKLGARLNRKHDVFDSLSGYQVRKYEISDADALHAELARSVEPPGGLGGELRAKVGNWRRVQNDIYRDCADELDALLARHAPGGAG